jgi:F-type H+-transporting ATPase subunit delta
LLPEIAAQFEVLRAQSERVADVDVISALELTAEQAHKLQTVLERRLGLAVRLHPQVDRTLVGGAIVRYGDFVVDGSLRGRIERLGAAMAGA